MESIDPAILDTDMLSETFKDQNPLVRSRAVQYLTQHGKLAFSDVSWYEVTRGLKEKGAARQLVQFAEFTRKSVVFAITHDIVERATDLWAEGRRAGHPHEDADLFIAATAIENDRTLVTGNLAHFEWIPGLRLENWRQ